MRIRTAAVLGLAVAVSAAGIGAMAGWGAAQPGPLAPQTPAPATVYQAWLPPGTYTAIVLTSNAKERRWTVALKTSRGSFPVTVGPNETLVVPFLAGLRVKAEDQARLESTYVPFEDISLRNPLDGNENLAISAWGITDQGPVSFSPPAPKKK